jgi:hypothetical protein
MRMPRCLPAIVVAGLLSYGPTCVAAQRTFVASNGIDSHPCSVTEPCRSFTTALAHTDDDGEIIVKDSAGYGPVAIAQSVKIFAPPGVYAGITVFSGDGVVVNGTSAVSVVLRGLTINGQGGSHGIYFVNGGSLAIEDSIIEGMKQNGVIIAAHSSRSTLRNVTVRNNPGVGVSIFAVAAQARVDIDAVHVEGNGGDGLFVGTGARVTIRNSTFSRNAGNGIEMLLLFAGLSSQLSVTMSSITLNSGIGISITHPGSGHQIDAHLSDNVIAENFDTGIQVKGPASGMARTQVALVGNRLFSNQGGGVYFLDPSGASVFGWVTRNTAFHHPPPGDFRNEVLAPATVTTHGQNVGTTSGTFSPGSTF